jgi:cyanophycinase
VAQGTLLIVGGSERIDKRLAILHTWIDLCAAVPGRRDQVIITSATGHAEALGGEYVKHFRQLGWPAHLIFMPPLATREAAQDPGVAALIRQAAGIWMTGGDQVDLVDILRDTPAGNAMTEAYLTGSVVGGTSAGASAVGDPMIARGGGSGEVRPGDITLHPGFGYAGHSLIIDTHFGRRGRFPRLAHAVLEHPAEVGLGLDENTALLVPPTGPAQVIGSGTAYIIESPTDRPPDHHTITMHLLRAGDTYDLASVQGNVKRET